MKNILWVALTVLVTNLSFAQVKRLSKQVVQVRYQDHDFICGSGHINVIIDTVEYNTRSKLYSVAGHVEGYEHLSASDHLVSIDLFQNADVMHNWHLTYWVDDAIAGIKDVKVIHEYSWLLAHGAFKVTLTEKNDLRVNGEPYAFISIKKQKQRTIRQ